MTRQSEFAAGINGPTETPSLQANAQKFNAADPHKFIANGLNQPIMLSRNDGNSAQDAARQTPTGQLPDRNGMSNSTYNKLVPQYGMSLAI